jgi:DGQHR domain-containing protein
MKVFRYPALRARQAPGNDVFVFAADPQDVLSFARIDRVSRDSGGELKGFQRHQISSHIKEIRSYLSNDDALLPNAVIVAFVDGIHLKKSARGALHVSIDARKGPPGFVVDGQQRLTALSGLEKPGFQVLVSGLVCQDYDQLRQQFVLVNSTRPLPRTLIYELLPTIDGLPERFTARKFAARIVEHLNYSGSSAIRGQIRQHTSPGGVISDTAMQKLIMNSASNGAIREFMRYEDREDKSFRLVDEYFAAVQETFRPEWVGMSPRHSRLRHGAGIVAMGFVMDQLHASLGATTRAEFREGLEGLKPATAWTSGTWKIDGGDVPWNGIQNTPTHIDLLTRFLVSTTKRHLRHLQRTGAIG